MGLHWRAPNSFIHSFFIFIYLGTVTPSVHEKCFSGGRGTNVSSLRFDSSLKGGKRWCLFNIKFKAILKLWSTKRYALCPLLVFRKGIERSVSVFLSSLTFRVDFFSNKLERYFRTRPFSDLYTVVAVSPLMMSLTVGQFKLCIEPIEGVAKLLFVTILAARFCNFCKVCCLVTPQHPIPNNRTENGQSRTEFVFDCFPNSENGRFGRFGRPAKHSPPRGRRFGSLWRDYRCNLLTFENEANLLALPW